MFPEVRYLEVLRPLNFLTSETAEYEATKRKILSGGRPISDFDRKSALTVEDMVTGFAILACEHRFNKTISFLRSVDDVKQFCAGMKKKCDFVDVYEVHYQIEPRERERAL